MAQQINVDIQVKGQKIAPFSSLTINQQFSEHHYFELRFNGDVIEDTNAVIFNKSKDFLGEKITITFSALSGSDYQDNVFIGVITEISVANQSGGTGDLLFKGYSPTYLLENGEHKEGFLDKSISQIVKDVLHDIPTNMLSSSINDTNNEPDDYVVQYNESDFEFIRRLAAQDSRWFFYDGTKLMYGKPSSSPTISLSYPHDISSLNLNVKVLAQKYGWGAYWQAKDEQFKANSQDTPGLDSFGTLAQNVSNKLFTKPHTAPVGGVVKEQADLDDLVAIATNTDAADMVTLKASSDSPYVKLGTIVSVSAYKEDKSTEDFGKYIVTSVTHFTDQLGNYSNVFEGVPSTLQILPTMYLYRDKLPVGQTERAKVVSVDDPEHSGKVQVQYPEWEPAGNKTPFIEVISPYAGKRGNGKKNRGLFFTPEVGDLVTVHFIANNPDYPYVVGSVPDGLSIDTSMNSDNNAKAIRTRSGNTIYFYDKENSQTQQIRIETDEKNYISINVPNGKGAIQIYSTDTIELVSETSVTITSKDINIKASGNIDMEANQNITIKAGQNLAMSANMKLSAQGTQLLEVKSTQVSIAGDAQTQVKGTQLTLQGDAMTTIKGGVVMIN